MEIKSNLVLTEKELVKLGSSIEEVSESLTLPNPEYANMKRFGKGFYRKIDPHICYLKKEGDQYILPRYYFGEPMSWMNNNSIEGRELKSSVKITLRDYQDEFISDNSSSIIESTGLLLEAPCGHGKTVLGIWLSYERGVQTMVLVPTYYLAKQWEARIKQYSTGSSVIMRSTDKEVPIDRDFTIVVMDLFSCRTLPKALVKNVGHVILDEAHKIGAETYLPILDEIPAKFRTALTATFRRADGVHRVLAYHFGKHIQMPNRFPRPRIYGVYTGVKIRGVCSRNRPHKKFIDFLDSVGHPYHLTKGVIHVEPTEELLNIAGDKVKDGSLTKTSYKEISSCLRKASEMSYSVVDSYLNEHSSRRKLAIKVVKECLDSGRTVLFLSKRKDTLKALHKYFAEYKPMLIVSETNERSLEEEEYLQNTCRLVLGVTQLAKEGLDIDRLDTVIFHLPMKDTEQATGRVSRLHEFKKFPLGLYLLDDCPITYAVFNNAKKFFRINADYKGERTLQTLKTVL